MPSLMCLRKDSYFWALPRPTDVFLPPDCNVIHGLRVMRLIVLNMHYCHAIDVQESTTYD